MQKPGRKTGYELAMSRKKSAKPSKGS